MGAHFHQVRRTCLRHAVSRTVVVTRSGWPTSGLAAPSLLRAAVAAKLGRRMRPRRRHLARLHWRLQLVQVAAHVAGRKVLEAHVNPQLLSLRGARASSGQAAQLAHAEHHPAAKVGGGVVAVRLPKRAHESPQHGMRSRASFDSIGRAKLQRTCSRASSRASVRASRRTTNGICTAGTRAMATERRRVSCAGEPQKGNAAASATCQAQHDAREVRGELEQPRALGARALILRAWVRHKSVSGCVQLPCTNQRRRRHRRAHLGHRKLEDALRVRRTRVSGVRFPFRLLTHARRRRAPGTRPASAHRRAPRAARGCSCARSPRLRTPAVAARHDKRTCVCVRAGGPRARREGAPAPRGAASARAASPRRSSARLLCFHRRRRHAAVLSSASTADDRVSCGEVFCTPRQAQEATSATG
jgi:hypothetical protein